MLNKISYLSKSASLVCALLFVGMIQEIQKSSPMSPGPHMPDAIKPGPHMPDAIKLVSF